jgi:hypothetical protein
MHFASSVSQSPHSLRHSQVKQRSRDAGGHVQGSCLLRCVGHDTMEIYSGFELTGAATSIGPVGPKVVN